MAIQVEVNADDVMENVKAAILDSALGKHIKGAIEKVVAEVDGTRFSRDDVVTAAVRAEIREIIIKTVKSEFGEKIKEQIREKITDEFVQEAFSKLWAAWTESRF